jgi:hypothetical protein
MKGPSGRERNHWKPLSRATSEGLLQSSPCARFGVRLFAPETNPPKIKRFILLAFDDKAESAAILFINTEIPKNPYIKSLQYPIKASEKSFISHDSFIDCSHLYERNPAPLRTAFIDDPGIYLGASSTQDLKAIRALVQDAKTVSPTVKRKYGLL